VLLLRGRHLFVVTPTGADVRELTPPGFEVESAAWSRDGRRVAIGANRHIWVMNADGSGLRQVTKGTLSEGSPAWSPDGRRIAFSSGFSLRRQGHRRWLMVMPAAGGRAARVGRFAGVLDPAWSPAGVR